MGGGLLEYAGEGAKLSIWAELCVSRSAVCRRFDHAGKAAIGRII
jgi:hypothetical protein